MIVVARDVPPAMVNPDTAPLWIKALGLLGGDFAPQDLAAGDFSLIGVPGARVGAAHQSLGVQPTAGAPPGALRGRIARDGSSVGQAGYLYTFVAPEAVPFRTSQGNGSAGPQIIVGDPASPIARGDFFTHPEPGYGILELNAATLQVVAGNWYPATTDPDRGIPALTSELRRVAADGGRTLVFLVSSKATDPSAIYRTNPSMAQALYSAAQHLGAHGDLFARSGPGSSYTFVGGVGLRSKDTSGALKYNGGGELSGLLARDNDNLYGVTAGLSGTPLDFSLAESAWREPPAFIYANESWYPAAAKWFAQRLGLSSDPRDYYATIGPDQLSDKREDLGGLTFQAGRGFEQGEFDALKAAYLTEFEQVGAVDDLFASLQTPMHNALSGTAVATATGKVLLAVVQEKEDAERQPVKFDWGLLFSQAIEGIAGLTEALKVVEGTGPASMLASSIAITGSLIESADDSEDTPTPDYTDRVIVEGADLQDTIQNGLLSAIDRLDVVRILVVSDPVKLAALGDQAADLQKVLGDSGTQGAATKRLLVAARQQAYPALLAVPFKLRRLLDPRNDPSDRYGCCRSFLKNDPTNTNWILQNHAFSGGFRNQEWIYTKATWPQTALAARLVQGQDESTLWYPGTGGDNAYDGITLTPLPGRVLTGLTEDDDKSTLAPDSLMRYVFGDPYGASDAPNAGINPEFFFTDPTLPSEALTWGG